MKWQAFAAAVLAVCVPGTAWGWTREIDPAKPPRLRGVHVNHEDKVWGDESKAQRKMAELARDWRVNAVRVHLDLTREPELRGPLPERLSRLVETPSYRNLFHAARDAELWLIVDLFPRPDESGWPPGGWNALWEKEDLQRQFVDGWIRIAQHFEGDAKVILDLLNEPEVVGPLKAQVPRVAAKWNDLIATTIRALRAGGRDHWIAVEPLWGAVHNLALLERQQDARVLYTFHFFHPHWFTHQGARGDWPPGGTVRYPGQGYGDFAPEPARHWDRNALRELLEPARHFQRKHSGVRMVMGEGGCIVNAPSPDREHWLADVVDLLDAEGWDWLVFSGPGFYLEETPAEEALRARLQPKVPERGNLSPKHE